MKKIRLAETAEKRLAEIAEFTLERFGEQKVIEYGQQLTARVAHLASGEPPLGRSCEGFGFANLRYYREGMHYLIYSESTDLIYIYDFVHVSRNLPAILAELEANRLK